MRFVISKSFKNIPIGLQYILYHRNNNQIKIGSYNTYEKMKYKIWYIH